MKPSIALQNNRDRIRAIINRFKTTNPRIFGSAAVGEDTEESDLDILVDALPGLTLFDLGGLQDELETLLGIRVDIRTPGELPKKWRDSVVAGAQPL